MESKQMKLSKETRFYYLDYLQKQINKVVSKIKNNEIPSTPR